MIKWISLLNSWLISYVLNYIIYKIKKEDKRYEINFLVAI
jgi:hypothetical protein